MIKLRRALDGTGRQVEPKHAGTVLYFRYILTDGLEIQNGTKQGEQRQLPAKKKEEEKKKQAGRETGSPKMK